MVRAKSGPNDLVTEADEAAEVMITAGLQHLFPGCLVVGEEATAATRGCWTVWRMLRWRSWWTRSTARPTLSPGCRCSA